MERAFRARPYWLAFALACAALLGGWPSIVSAYADPGAIKALEPPSGSGTCGSLSLTWSSPQYAEIYGAASGNLLQRTPTVSYDETYIVEYQNGGWIVTDNEV